MHKVYSPVAWIYTSTYLYTLFLCYSFKKKLVLYIKALFGLFRLVYFHVVTMFVIFSLTNNTLDMYDLWSTAVTIFKYRTSRLH